MKFKYWIICTNLKKNEGLLVKIKNKETYIEDCLVFSIADFNDYAFGGLFFSSSVMHSF